MDRAWIGPGPAVAELERAKILERVTRATALRLAQGRLPGCGIHTFGYERAEHQGFASMVMSEHVFEMPSCRPACVVFLFHYLNFEMA